MCVLNPQFIRGARAWCQRHPVLLLNGPEPDSDIAAAQPGPGGLDGKPPALSRTGTHSSPLFPWALKTCTLCAFYRSVSKPIYGVRVINLWSGWRCGSVSSCPLFSCSWFGMVAVAALTQTPLEFLVLHLFYVCTG